MHRHSARADGDGPLVTVVMPVHNQRRFIQSSVASLLDQTLRDFELVIGCDGSDDGTRDVLERFAAADSRIRLLRRERKSGLSASANWVVEAARSPVVAIAHGDDLSRPDRLERQLAALQSEPGVVAVASVPDGIDPLNRRVQPPNLWRLVAPSPFASFSHSSVMFRRSAFDRAGGYRSGCDFWEDLDLWWRLAREGRVLVSTVPLVSYRHSTSTVRGREAPIAVERSQERMYRAAALKRRGCDYDEVLDLDLAAERRPIRPRIFIARSWMPLWCGKRPGVFVEMLERARLRPDFATAQALIFVGWATISPKSLRLCLRAFLKARNVLARRLLGGAAWVEWRPDPGAHLSSARLGDDDSEAGRDQPLNPDLEVNRIARPAA